MIRYRIYYSNRRIDLVKEGLGSHILDVSMVGSSGYSTLKYNKNFWTCQFNTVILL